MKKRLLLVDDHALFSASLRSLLEREQDFEVIGEADHGVAAVRQARLLRPDLVLVDLAMPGLNGIEATRRMTTEMTGIKVLALSMHSDPRFVEAALEAGAAGYLLKSCTFEELGLAIRTVLAGRAYLSPAIAGAVVDALRKRRPAGATAATALTQREREVLQLLAEGHGTREIGCRLCMSPKTVHTHRKKIMEKLRIPSVAGLTKYAIQEGLTSLPRL